MVTGSPSGSNEPLLTEATAFPVPDEMVTFLVRATGSWFGDMHAPAHSPVTVNVYDWPTAPAGLVSCTTTPTVCGPAGRLKLYVSRPLAPGSDFQFVEVVVG